MALTISFRQMKIFALSVISLIALWLIIGHFVWVKVSRTELHQVWVDYYFLAPMNTNRALDNFHIRSEVKGDRVNYQQVWHSPFHLTIKIDESDYPRGVEYTYSFNKSKALIPPFTVSKQGTILTKVTPELISVTPQKNAPTLGPITLRFNTPISPQSIGQHIQCDAQGEFKPLEGNLTTWQFIPHQPLKHQKTYHFTVKAGLKSLHGAVSKQEQQVAISTVPQFKFIQSYPKNGDNSVWLSRTIKFTVNQPVKEANIKANFKGKTEIKDNTVYYIPERVFLPASKYQVEADITSVYGEKLTAKISFATTYLGNEKWLEVKAGKPCSVWLMQGSKELSCAEGWFTRSLDKLPLVTMYEINRGTGSGAAETGEKLPWIKLNSDILLHSTDYRGVDDHQQLGLPHSYSCLLLPAEVLEKLTKEFKKGFMVIVH